MRGGEERQEAALAHTRPEAECGAQGKEGPTTGSAAQTRKGPGSTAARSRKCTSGGGDEPLPPAQAKGAGSALGPPQSAVKRPWAGTRQRPSIPWSRPPHAKRPGPALGPPQSAAMLPRGLVNGPALVSGRVLVNCPVADAWPPNERLDAESGAKAPSEPCPHTDPFDARSARTEPLAESGPEEGWSGCNVDSARGSASGWNDPPSVSATGSAGRKEPLPKPAREGG